MEQSLGNQNTQKLILSDFGLNFDNFRLFLADFSLWKTSNTRNWPNDIQWWESQLYMTFHNHWNSHWVTKVRKSWFLVILGSILINLGYFRLIFHSGRLQKPRNRSKSINRHEFQQYIRIHTHSDGHESTKVGHSRFLEMSGAHKTTKGG